MSTKPGKYHKRHSTILAIVTGVAVMGIVVALTVGRGLLGISFETFFLDAAGSLQRFFSFPARAIVGVWHDYAELYRVREENAHLQREIERLKTELAQYREYRSTHPDLLRLLNLKKQADRPLLGANIVGKDLAPWVDSVTIDRGRRDGVGSGSVVRAGGGVAGQVVETSLFFSKVMLLTDPASGIAALVQRTRVPGILRGAGKGSCVLTYVGKGSDVVLGDEIVTSGMDGVFPKGLPIGTVSAIRPPSESDLFMEITVTPHVRVELLEHVLVDLAPDTETGHTP